MRRVTRAGARRAARLTCCPARRRAARPRASLEPRTATAPANKTFCARRRPSLAPPARPRPPHPPRGHAGLAESARRVPADDMSRAGGASPSSAALGARAAPCAPRDAPAAGCPARRGGGATMTRDRRLPEDGR